MSNVIQFPAPRPKQDDRIIVCTNVLAPGDVARFEGRTWDIIHPVIIKAGTPVHEMIALLNKASA